MERSVPAAVGDRHRDRCARSTADHERDRRADDHRDADRDDGVGPVGHRSNGSTLARVSDELDDEKWWVAHAGDLAVRSLRTHLLDATAKHLASLASRPIVTREVAHAGNYRSLVLGVAQYWNDQADDECHIRLTGATTDEPSGLHECAYGNEPGSGDPACSWCARDGLDDPDDLFGNLYGPLIPAVEAFCAESAHQNMAYDDAYRPWAIARVVADGSVATHVVGALVRPWLDLPTTRAAHFATDDRVLALAGERDARDVLIDALIEANDPRGEALAHGAIDPDLARSWLGNLDPHVPRSGLEIVGGLPDAIGLYLDREPERDERLAFAFRPAVRFLPGSKRTIWPALAPARSLGPLDEAALLELAECDAVFRARELELELHDRAQLRALLDALVHARRQLPELRVLRMIGEISRDAIGGVRRAELDGLELEVTTAGIDVDDHVADVIAWRKLGVAVAMYDADAQRAAGWVASANGTVQRRGFHRHADAPRGARLVGVLR